jgi:tRNA (cytidine/uridine-2'-O-)-methyltransferase
MDYWDHLEWRRWPNWTAFEAALPPNANLWFIESNGPRRYTDAKYGADDFLIFGRETAGLPRSLLDANRQRWLRIPMFNSNARSLNLSNCVALVLFESLRQIGFPGDLQE